MGPGIRKLELDNQQSSSWANGWTADGQQGVTHGALAESIFPIKLRTAFRDATDEQLGGPCDRLLLRHAIGRYWLNLLAFAAT